jgi:hypothetical protein
MYGNNKGTCEIFILTFNFIFKTVVSKHFFRPFPMICRVTLSFHLSSLKTHLFRTVSANYLCTINNVLYGT